MPPTNVSKALEILNPNNFERRMLVAFYGKYNHETFMVSDRPWQSIISNSDILITDQNTLSTKVRLF